MKIFFVIIWSFVVCVVRAKLKPLCTITLGDCSNDYDLHQCPPNFLKVETTDLNMVCCIKFESVEQNIVDNAISAISKSQSAIEDTISNLKEEEEHISITEMSTTDDYNTNLQNNYEKNEASIIEGNSPQSNAIEDIMKSSDPKNIVENIDSFNKQESEIEEQQQEKNEENNQKQEEKNTLEHEQENEENMKEKAVVTESFSIDDTLTSENNEVNEKTTVSFSSFPSPSTTVEMLEMNTTANISETTQRIPRRRPKKVNFKTAESGKLNAGLKNEVLDSFKRRQISQRSMQRPLNNKFSKMNPSGKFKAASITSRPVIIPALMTVESNDGSKRTEYVTHDEATDDFNPTQANSGQNEDKGDDESAGQSSENREANLMGGNENSNPMKAQQSFQTEQKSSGVEPHSDGHPQKSQNIILSHDVRTSPPTMQSSHSTANVSTFQLHHTKTKSPSSELLSSDNSGKIEVNTIGARKIKENVFNLIGRSSNESPKEQDDDDGIANAESSINENISAGSSRNGLAIQNERGEASISNDGDNEHNFRKYENSIETIANAIVTESDNAAAGSLKSLEQPNFVVTKHPSEKQSEETTNDVDDDSLKSEYLDTKNNEPENDSSEHEKAKSENSEKDDDDDETNDIQNMPRSSNEASIEGSYIDSDDGRAQGQQIDEHKSGRKDQVENNENDGEFNSKENTLDVEFSTLKPSHKNRQRGKLKGQLAAERLFKVPGKSIHDVEISIN